jgi:hypothetical protein
VWANRRQIRDEGIAHGRTLAGERSRNDFSGEAAAARKLVYKDAHGTFRFAV